MTILTIGIPTYNRPEALARILQQLESALDQTNQNVLVKVQDNSDPSIQGINRRTTEQFSHCYYEANDNNIGFGGNLLRILEQCQSEYLLYLSDDDELWIDNLPGMIKSLTEHKEESILLLPFTYGDDISTITNTNLQWSSSSIVQELYKHGLPFVLFSAFVIPVPHKKTKNLMLAKLLPYIKNCYLQMAFPVALQQLSKDKIKISYYDLPIVRYETSYKYGFSLKKTFESLHEILMLLLSTEMITSSLYKQKTSNNVRSHLLNALQHKGKLREIPEAKEDTVFILIKSLLSMNLKNWILMASLILAPSDIIKKILISRGHSNTSEDSNKTL